MVGNRRHHERIEAVECAHGASPKLFESSEIADHPGGGDSAGRGDDAPDGRVDACRAALHVVALDVVVVDEAADRGVSFGNEAAVVQQPRGLGECGERDRFHHDTIGAEPGHGGGEGLDPGRCHPRQLGGYRDPRSRRCGERCVGRDRSGIRTAGHVGHRGVRGVEVAGHDGHRIPGPAGGHQPPGGHHSEGGFDPDDALQRGGDSPRPGGVRADGDVRETQGHGDRGPGTRSARDVVRSSGIADTAERTALPDQSGRELIQVGRPDDRGPGGTQAGDRLGIGDRRTVGETRAPGGRREAGHVDVVLDRQQQPGQRTRRGRRLASHARPVADVDPHLGAADPVQCVEECGDP